MPKYVVFASYTPESWAAMIESPGDRTTAIAKAAGAVGGSVDAVYWMFGAHDVMVIGDMPDSASQAAFSVAVGSTGALKSLETHELIDADGLKAILAGAKKSKSAYTPPGK